MVSPPSEPCGNHGVLASLELGGRDLVGGNLWAGRTLLRGAFPSIAVATLIPMALFYLTLAAGSIVWAIGVSVLYAYGFAAFQYRRRRRVSGMLLMTVFMVTVRAVSAVASGHSMVYFAIPVAETAGFGLMFVATMWTSQPLIVRLARDLVPHLADDLATRRALIRRIVVDLDGDVPGQRGDDPDPAHHGVPTGVPGCSPDSGLVLGRRGRGAIGEPVPAPRAEGSSPPPWPARGLSCPPPPILVAPARTAAKPPVLATL